jgi:pimeloyl-ACP methyl ester carboxylesterase
VELAAAAINKVKTMSWILRPPDVEDFIRLFKAWRYWVVASLFGAVLGAAFFAIFPPPFRARATINVDFNLEEAWPEDTDRQQFYYLEREVRKLEEIAWSDAVLHAVAQQTNSSVYELRTNVLFLSQPAEAGWHFYADDHDPDRAAVLASTWGKVFVENARSEIDSQSGLSSFIQVEATQVDEIPVVRSVSEGTYLLSGSIILLVISASFLLFLKPT